MAYYLLQAAYTAESCAHQISNPQNVEERTRGVIERLGGKVECMFYAFGEYDIMHIVQFPDNVSAASLAMAVSAGGAVKAVKSTPLMTAEEGMEAFKRAAAAGYESPRG